ncbi:DNA-binding response regulator [Enterovibrio norvegicus FF-33]|uniref:DNA-binding response regulator n=1 Tax=Enterovibrio norvegicus FF-454 TaxID=1185651 RepID=A0A1E5C4B3_9GAMM|nr:response regulator transcription factor [Enterovibrio norvegicus]OEE60323.1 DNA-binding response regulator [Enterovibrio norvegicus FF-454]OEE70276.1 DNA-binding response regulator [Enterovibrio norvegicus FF-33]OEE77529.1 DNA-binding response regulator [Enterovibrio norvegicus FF-162]
MTTLLLADDHVLLQDGLIERLSRQPQFSILGAANDGDSAIDKALSLKPDILLTDISMPHKSGLEVLSVLRDKAPEIKVVILSMHNNKEYIMTAMRGGAKGYVLKDVSSQELVQALDIIANGGSYFSAGVSETLMESMSELENKDHDDILPTPREKDVLILIANGACNKTIARELDISVRTVETHRLRVKKKLGVTSTAGLVKYAFEQGWVNQSGND